MREKDTYLVSVAALCLQPNTPDTKGCTRWLVWDGMTVDIVCHSKLRCICASWPSRISNLHYLISGVGNVATKFSRTVAMFYPTIGTVGQSAIRFEVIYWYFNFP